MVPADPILFVNYLVRFMGPDPGEGYTGLKRPAWGIPPIAESCVLE